MGNPEDYDEGHEILMRVVDAAIALDHAKSMAIHGPYKHFLRDAEIEHHDAVVAYEEWVNNL